VTKKRKREPKEEELRGGKGGRGGGSKVLYKFEIEWKKTALDWYQGENREKERGETIQKEEGRRNS